MRMCSLVIRANMFTPVREPVSNCAGPPNESVLGWRVSARHGYVYTVSYNEAGLVLARFLMQCKHGIRRLATAFDFKTIQSARQSYP